MQYVEMLMIVWTFAEGDSSVRTAARAGGKRGAQARKKARLMGGVCQHSFRPVYCYGVRWSAPCLQCSPVYNSRNAFQNSIMCGLTPGVQNSGVARK